MADTSSTLDPSQAEPDTTELATKIAVQLRMEMLAGDDQIFTRAEAAAFLKKAIKTVDLH
jgi:hypothetical protein